MTDTTNRISPAALAEYTAFRNDWVCADLGQRTQLELRGADRQPFLHNLCTNHVRRLAPLQGCEAFVTSVQGKILGHVLIFCSTESLIVDTVPGQAEVLLSHFERYHIREKIELIDRSHEWADLLIAGPQAVSKLNGLIVGEAPSELYSHRSAQIDGQPVWLRATTIAGSGSILLSAQAIGVDQVRQRLVEAGAKPCGPESFNMMRVEAGTPWYGQDIFPDNLPQEVHRTELAISFNKGCYLGQETVARIDALGHVNRLLCGLKLKFSDILPAGTELEVDGKATARITSVAFSPRLGVPLAMAYVRREHARPSHQIRSQFGEAEIVFLPLA